MQGSAPHAALGLIVAGLALAALAAQRSVPPEAPPVAVFPAQPSAEKAELRALREGQRLDVNRASAEELTLIPGIGPKLAQRIVDERARRGVFANLAELRTVRGLGPKIWLRVEPFVQLGHDASKRYDSVMPACRYTGSVSSAVNTNTGFSCTPSVSSRESK